MQVSIKLVQEKIGAETVNSVEARELYEYLEIKKPFADWIKSQIKSLGLEENIDYITYKQRVKAGRGTTTRKEYIITLEASKHISMASRTDMGKKARQYFIDMEKKFLSLAHNSQIRGYKSQLSQKNKKIEFLQEKVLYLEARVGNDAKHAEPFTVTEVPSDNIALQRWKETAKNFEFVVDKLQNQNKLLKQTLIRFKDRYHTVVSEADDKVKAIRGELEKMTNAFQQLPNLANDGKNLNTDTLSKHQYW